MSLDTNFLKITSEYFNPYLPDSGTEHVAILLYSLLRMTKPKTAIEFGSGYSTMFVLRALADNAKDFQIEKEALREKTKENLNYASLEDITRDKDALTRWFFSEGNVCQINPQFFLTNYNPILYSFESLAENHEYVRKMKKAVEAIGHSEIFEYITGQEKSTPDVLDLGGKFIDFAWNDDTDYKEFFSNFWEVINPNGGLLVFHNAVSVYEWVEAINWMKEQRAHSNDLEVLTLVEPHKLNQNGCVILRRTSSYQPTFHMDYPHEILENTMHFMKQ